MNYRESGVWFQIDQEISSLLHIVQMDSEGHLTSYPMGNGNRPVREPGHSHTSSTKVQNAWSFTSTSPYVSWRGASSIMRISLFLTWWIRTSGVFTFRINSAIVNLIDSWQDSLDGRSARRKTATYTGQHKHRQIFMFQVGFELTMRRHFLP
jgi:hypothetical protein